MGGARRQHPAAGAQRVVLGREQPHPSRSSSSTTLGHPRRPRLAPTRAHFRHSDGRIGRPRRRGRGRRRSRTAPRPRREEEEEEEEEGSIPALWETGPEMDHVARPRAFPFPPLSRGHVDLSTRQRALNPSSVVHLSVSWSWRGDFLGPSFRGL